MPALLTSPAERGKVKLGQEKELGAVEQEADILTSWDPGQCAEEACGFTG
jgi:hypothetical protein